MFDGIPDITKSLIHSDAAFSCTITCRQLYYSHSTNEQCLLFSAFSIVVPIDQARCGVALSAAPRVCRALWIISGSASAAHLCPRPEILSALGGSSSATVSTEEVCVCHLSVALHYCIDAVVIKTHFGHVIAGLVGRQTVLLCIAQAMRR